MGIYTTEVEQCPLHCQEEAQHHPHRALYTLTLRINRRQVMRVDTDVHLLCYALM